MQSLGQGSWYIARCRVHEIHWLVRLGSASGEGGGCMLASSLIGLNGSGRFVLSNMRRAGTRQSSVSVQPCVFPLL